MLALISSVAPPHLELTEVAEPEPGDGEALVAVEAFSLNRGEVRALEGLPPGRVPGWDLAGTVTRAAADGSGPAEGARVVGMMAAAGGAWAQRVPVPTGDLAEITIASDLAAALPVAGLTALYAIEAYGSLLGRDVLVTGASGGVGRFAVQLAALAGARVTAVSGREPLGDERAYDLVVEGVGGESLGNALRAVRPRGLVVNFARTDRGPVPFTASDLFMGAPGARLQGLFVFEEAAHRGGAGEGLARLDALVAAGRLDPSVSVRESWREAGRVCRALMDREVEGKAVLLVD